MKPGIYFVFRPLILQSFSLVHLIKFNSDNFCIFVCFGHIYSNPIEKPRVSKYFPEKKRNMSERLSCSEGGEFCGSRKSAVNEGKAFHEARFLLLLFFAAFKEK